MASIFANYCLVCLQTSQDMEFTISFKPTKYQKNSSNTFSAVILDNLVLSPARLKTWPHSWRLVMFEAQQQSSNISTFCCVAALLNIRGRGRGRHEAVDSNSQHNVIRPGKILIFYWKGKKVVQEQEEEERERKRGREIEREKGEVVTFFKRITNSLSAVVLITWSLI